MNKIYICLLYEKTMILSPYFIILVKFGEDRSVYNEI